MTDKTRIAGPYETADEYHAKILKKVKKLFINFTSSLPPSLSFSLDYNTSKSLETLASYKICERFERGETDEGDMGERGQ